MTHSWRLMTVAGSLYATAIGITIVDSGDVFVSLIVTGTASVIVGVAVADMIHYRKDRNGQG